MNSFPLYTQLMDELENPEEVLADTHKHFLTDNIKKMTEHEHELIYALIRMYQLHNNETTSCILPYTAKRMKKGIKFDIDNLPVTLQHLLLQFTHTHLKTTNTL